MYTTLKEGYKVDTIYTDFSKAFDRVDNDILLYKLNQYFNLCQWIKAYLKEMTQMVQLGNHYSDPIIVTPDGPQGNHLGPVLFSLFVNDLACQFDDWLSVGDDIKILVELLENILEILSSWYPNNFMGINTG